MRLWLACVSLISVLAIGLAGCKTEADDDDTFEDDDSSTGDDDSAGDDDAGDDDSAAGGPDIFVNPVELAFGEVCIGTPATIPLVIGNDGDAPLQVANMIPPEMSMINMTPFTGAIPPGGNPVAVDVTANCTDVEVGQGQLRIVSNDPDENPFIVPVIVNCAACAG